MAEKIPNGKIELDPYPSSGASELRIPPSSGQTNLSVPREEVGTVSLEGETQQMYLELKQRLILLAGQMEVQDRNVAIQEEKIRASRARLLQAKDQIIGSNAQILELEYQLQVKSADWARLSSELSRVYGSWTWKIGRFVTLPVWVARRVISKFR